MKVFGTNINWGWLCKRGWDGMGMGFVHLGMR